MMDNEQPHVEVTLVSYRGLVDKSLNLTFNVDERFKRTALELFSDIGATGILVRVTPEAAREKMIRDAGEPPEPQGQACNKAINLCKDKDFWRFLEHQYKTPMITSEYFAGKQLKKILGIKSRRELDKDGDARNGFTRLNYDFEIWRPATAEL